MEVQNERHTEEAMHYFFEMWENNLYCDVRLKTGTKIIQGHKIVLSAMSEYFKNLFNNHSKAVTSLEYDLDDTIFTEDVLDQIMRYAYTGKIVIDAQNVQDLLIAACVLKIKFIQIECHKFMPLKWKR